jgi:hypothetical protein
MPNRPGTARRPDFASELIALGTPARLADALYAFLEERHPGNQERIYHGLAHSCEVAGLTARLMRSWPNVPADRKILLVLSAALHDVDPKRPPNTPARVKGTLALLATDPQARRLLGEFETRFGFTRQQVSALILATDYSPHPDEMREKLYTFERAHRAAFGDDPWISEWGRRLAYWDKIATYLGPLERTRRRVAGLAREFRSRGIRPPAGMRAESRRFLLELRIDPLFQYLPEGDRARFDAVIADFSRAAERAPATARGARRARRPARARARAPRT